MKPTFMKPIPVKSIRTVSLLFASLLLVGRVGFAMGERPVAPTILDSLPGTWVLQVGDGEHCPHAVEVFEVDGGRSTVIRAVYNTGPGQMELIEHGRLGEEQPTACGAWSGGGGWMRVARNCRRDQVVTATEDRLSIRAYMDLEIRNDGTRYGRDKVELLSLVKQDQRLLYGENNGRVSCELGPRAGGDALSVTLPVKPIGD